MAIDSANKRLSAINAGLTRIQPFPSGSLTLTDRAIVLGIFAHDSFPTSLIVLDLFKPQIKNLKQKGQIIWLQ